MPENFNKNLEQKSAPPPPPPKKKNQIWILCQNSLTRELKIRAVGFVLKKPPPPPPQKKKIRFGFFVKIHLLE